MIASTPPAAESPGHASPAAEPEGTLHPVTSRVRHQYEHYPYPAPPPPDVRRFPLFGAMDYVQHVLWPGRRDLAGLRVLDAGCGTGEAAVHIARQYPEIEVTAIDLSDTSLDITRSLAREMGVGGNLTLHRLPIEEAATLGGPFDYIVASGVLHHLVNPPAGLQALANLLTPTGGLGVLLYGSHGRYGVYMMQDLLRRLAGTRELAEQVGYTRQLLASWPPDHPFQPGEWSDVRSGNDAGLVDLLLHVQDRSYTVPQIVEFLDTAGLRLERFYDPVLYRPSSYVANPEVASAIPAGSTEDQAALAELLHGRMAKHLFFATRAAYQPARIDPEGLVLLAMRPKRSPMFAWDNVETRGKKRAQRLVVRQFVFDRRTRTIELGAWNARVLHYCDGERTAAEIFELPEVYTSIPGLTADEKLDTYGKFMELMAAQVVLLFEP
jgi:SAM-dependent methyltransferase